MRPSLIDRFPAACLALAMVISGTVGAFVTEAGLDPVTTVFWRCVFGCLALGIWCLARGYFTEGGLSPKRLAIATLGGVFMVLNWVVFFAAFRMTSIATTTIVYHVQPFFVVLIGIAVFKERVTLDQLVWMIAAFIGVVLASGIGFSSGALDPRWMLGIGLTLVGSMLYATTTVVAKSLGEQRAEITAFCQTLVGIVILAPFVNFSQAISAWSWGWLVGIGLLHTGIAFVLMYAAYPRLKTPVIGILTFIYPLVAIIVDWSIYGHPIRPQQAAGMVLIAVATFGVRLGWRMPWLRPASVY